MLIPCQECKKSISSEAKECPNCGRPVEELWVKAHTASPREINRAGCGCAAALIFFIAMALLAGFAIFGGDNDESAGAPDSESQQRDVCDYHLAEAYTLAQAAIKRTLSVPNSVDFPWLGVGDTAVVADNDALCTYKVLSILEAQNLYGATLERRWTARVKYIKADGTFKVDFAKVLE